MSRNIFRNKEFKWICSAFIVIFAVFSICLTLLSFRILSSLNKSLIDRNIYIIEAILRDNPELETKIMPVFTKALDYEKLGTENLYVSKYGYDSGLALNLIPLLDSTRKGMLEVFLALFAGMLVFLLLILYKAFKYFYKRINVLSIGAEKIMRGSFDLILPEDGEGDLPVLGNRFNQMSKRLRLTLEELNEEKLLLKDMISNFSHQLKTPLASLKVFNELLLEGASNDKQILEEFLHKSKQQLERMDWLIQTLLKLSKLEAGMTELEMRPGDLGATVMNAVASLEMNWSMKQQNLSQKGFDREYLLKHDRDWLCEAFENIMKNAIDYTTEKGNINILIKDTESTIIIEVSDSGVGIPKEELPYVFDRFFKGSKTKELSQNSTGIGLALAKLIIEKHEGIISVYSEEGMGTCFTVVFNKYPTENK